MFGFIATDVSDYLTHFIMGFGRNVIEQALNDYSKIDLSETNID